jgi:hypothetical protein
MALPFTILRGKRSKWHNTAELHAEPVKKERTGSVSKPVFSAATDQLHNQSMQYVLRRWYVKFWKINRKILFREGGIKRG